MESEEKHIAKPGKFLLVSETYLDKQRRVDYDTLDEAHAAASEFWIAARQPSSRDGGPKSAYVYDDQGRKCPPSSYLNTKRPPSEEAMELEAAQHTNMTYDQAFKALVAKGYYTLPPHPWALGYADRGMGHGSYGVLDAYGDLIVGALSREVAEHIVAAVNSYTPPPAPAPEVSPTS